MMPLHIPSKTYLLGEYIVLEGEPGLILNTPPYFKVDYHVISNNRESNGICEKSSREKNPFHPRSPASLLLEKNADFFKNSLLEFFDPHEGKGGFGASGAQFIAVYNALHGIEKKVSWLEKLLENYWDLLRSNHSVLTSGADIVAQICASFEAKGEENLAEVIYWNRRKKQLDRFTWPFANLSYCLIRSGYKCATHENIKKLRSTAVKEMSNIVKEGYTAFQSKNFDHFLAAVQSYSEVMKREKCLLEETDELVQFLYQSNLIEVAKGCGAMGADVVLILLRSEKIALFLNWLKGHHIAAVGWGNLCEAVIANPAQQGEAIQ